MTSPVVTVPPSASIKVVAEVLLNNRVSAAPVVDPHGHVLGVVSEADLLVKEIAMGSGAHLPWLEGRHAQDIRRRREAVSAEDLMSSPAISVHPDTLLRQAARTMCEKRIKRLPVLADGWLVGIVSQATCSGSTCSPTSSFTATPNASSRARSARRVRISRSPPSRA